jgi:hypothetical protein
MLADDFVGGIALETLRARIPARHNAGTIQHVDCIIFDRLDEKAVTAIVRFGEAKLAKNVHCASTATCGESLALFHQYGSR